METFVKGDVVVIPFPFTDLSRIERRPAIVVTKASENDFILCQITTRYRDEAFSVLVKEEDFLEGSLMRDSMIRTNKIFTADKKLVKYRVGSVKADKVMEVENKIVELIRR